MRYALVNCDIYTGESVLYDKAIVVNGPRIESLLDIDKVPKDIDVHDLKGDSIAPGFIDIQANGGGGKLFTDEPTEDCVSLMCEAHKHFGTTNFLPTLISTSYEKMIQAIDTIKSLMANSKFGVLGLHLEGPYINEGKGGAHDKRYIRRISNEEVDSLIERGKGIITIFTVAPEVVEGPYIKKNEGSRNRSGGWTYKCNLRSSGSIISFWRLTSNPFVQCNVTTYQQRTRCCRSSA